MPTYSKLSLFPVEMLSSPHQEPTNSSSLFNKPCPTLHRYKSNATVKQERGHEEQDIKQRRREYNTMGHQ